MTAEQITELRRLIEETGYLPMSNRAMRLFSTLEQRPAADQTLVRELRQRLDATGYLPNSKALSLLEELERTA
jgi:hypothetical protein